MGQEEEQEDDEGGTATEVATTTTTDMEKDNGETGETEDSNADDTKAMED